MHQRPSYVVVGTCRRRRAPLPLTIGSGGDADIIVNAPALADHAYTLRAVGPRLELLRHSAGMEQAPLAILGSLGLRMMGPVPGLPDRGGAKRVVHEAFARFRSLPRVTKAGLAAAALIFGLVMAHVAHGDGRPPDLAAVVRPLRFDAVRSEPFGAIPGNPRFVKGYERGATFAVSLPVEAVGKPALVTFQAGGLDIGREVALEANGVQVFESQAEGDCVQQLCAKSVRLPATLLRSDPLTLRFVHRNPESSWLVGRLLVRSLPSLTEVEREEAVQWLDLAKRAYDERTIVPENLVVAADYLARARKLADEREGAAEIGTKAAALAALVDEAFSKVADDLKTAVAVDEQLGKRVEAEQELNQLLRLYPDPNSDIHAAIARHLRGLKENRQ